MKAIRFILLFLSFAVATSAIAQSPQRFNYQAVAKDASGNPLSEKTISIKMSIVDGSAGGTTLFSETHSAKTSKVGLFAIQVGGGTLSSGAFSSIEWNASPKFLKVEIDPTGGSSFALLGTSQLLSVPYAFAADKLVTPLSLKDLGDVSDDTPTTGSVLKWDGSKWVPGSGSSLITTNVLSGDGTAASPLTIAQKGATNGQVLQWNGSEWKPATVSGGVGDNWGSQSVVTNTSLSGTGIAGSPLALSQQGATNGQILKWTGTAWSPANDAGDNWGAAKVNTSLQFEGDGTPGNPLKLGQNSATTGQFLKWSGTSWIPGDGIGGGGLTLPASGNVTDPGTGLQIQNNNGSGIWGINGSTTNGSVYGVRGSVLNSTGANTAGVYGLNGASGTNGYGVLGVHSGSGVGILGQALTGNGIGVAGEGKGPSGVGVSGIGPMGLYGYSGIANGKGIYATSVPTAWAGYFAERVYIETNASATRPTLNLNEIETSDRARLRFTNNVVNQYWDIAAFNSTVGVDQDRLGIVNGSQGEILTVSGAGYVGISQGNPTQRLDVNGSVKISGGILANGSFGGNGQVLQSTAGGITWASSTNQLFNNTILYDQNSAVNNISTVANSLPGLNNMTFTTTGTCRVIMTFSQGQFVSNGTGDVDLQVEVGFMNASATAVINKAIINDVIINNKKKSISFTHHCQFSTPGTYLPYVYVGTTNGGKFNALSANGAGQVSIQIIPQ